MRPAITPNCAECARLERQCYECEKRKKREYNAAHPKLRKRKPKPRQSDQVRYTCPVAGCLNEKPHHAKLCAECYVKKNPVGAKYAARKGQRPDVAEYMQKHGMSLDVIPPSERKYPGPAKPAPKKQTTLEERMDIIVKVDILRNAGHRQEAIALHCDNFATPYRHEPMAIKGYTKRA